MWEKAGVIRNKESLSRLIDELEKLKENLNSCGVNDGKELVKKLETGNMLLVGEAVARSALFREESRGAHYREDFPDEGGERWMKNILIKRNNDGGNTVLILDRKD
jgi:succinate dehydrogenase/fumarate reductase flavoprotein subunit